MALERDTILHKRYRIVEILGQGGMGSVYRAVDQNLGVHVAVKENLFTTDEYARQFRLEAVILANLRHANLPRVSDHFVVGEQGQYLVMDFIEGEDLRQRMERLGRIDEEDAIQIGAAMCDALGYLHSRKPSILHRDLKPGNVKITPDGHIFLVDFGLAKLVQGGQATTSGARAMTPGYSPPEQYGTARTDPRTDIYSLGATLYAAISGIIPEDGLARAMDNAQLTPLRKRNPRISRRLAAAIEKAMAIDPSDRFQAADDFKKALLNSKSRTVPLASGYAASPAPEPSEADPSEARTAREKRNRSARPQPSAEGEQPFVSPRKKQLERDRRRTRRLTSLFFLSIATIVSGALLFAPGVSTVGRQALAPFLAAPATATPTVTFTPTLASTSTQRATASRTQAPPTLTATPTSTPTNMPEPSATATVTALIAQTAAPLVIAPAIDTPTGGGFGQVAFASIRSGLPQIYLVGLDGGEPQQITNLPDGACQPAWSPDGGRLAFSSPCKGVDEYLYQAGLHIINADGTGLVSMPTAPGGDFDPAWSPDGQRIAFTSLRSGTMEIYGLNLADQAVVQLTHGSSDLQARQPAWSPDGSRIAYAVKRFGTVYQIWLMGASGENPVQIVRSGVAFSDYLPAWSPDGSLILFNHRRANVISLPYIMSISADDRTMEQGAPMDLNALPIEDVEYSSDGLWLLYEGEEDAQDRDIVLTSISGEGRTRLTSAVGLDFDPAWRPTAAP
jgi:serine/threonine protein kinase